MAIIVKKTQSAPGLFHGRASNTTRKAVLNLIATAALDGSEITLTWSPPNVQYNQNTSLYQIYKANQFINSVPGTTTTYVDTAVMPGVEYVYTVFLVYSPL